MHLSWAEERSFNWSDTQHTGGFNLRRKRRLRRRLRVVSEANEADALLQDVQV